MKHLKKQHNTISMWSLMGDACVALACVVCMGSYAITVHAAASSTTARVSVYVNGLPSKPVLQASSHCVSELPEVHLSWGQTSATDYYDIARDSLPLVDNVLVENYTDQVITAGNTYVYVVTAVGPEGNTASDAVTVSVPADICEEAPPPDPQLTIVSFHARDASLPNLHCTDKRPKFTGTTNMADAIIQIGIFPGPVMVYTTYANENGYWDYTPTTNLDVGSYTFQVTATDPNDASREITRSIQFEITKNSSEDDDDEGNDDNPNNDDEPDIPEEPQPPQQPDETPEENPQIPEEPVTQELPHTPVASEEESEREDDSIGAKIEHIRKIITEKPSRMIDSAIAGLIGSDDPERIKEIRKEITVATATVATTATLPILSNILSSLRILASAPLRRRKRWGIVYDAQTGKPIPYAVVSIYDTEGNIKETKNTDANGAYFFLARPGTYTIQAYKDGYEALDKIHSDSFQTFYDNSFDRSDRISLQNDDIVSVNVPMRIADGQSRKKFFNRSFILHSIFWAGFAASAVALLVSMTTFNIVVFAVYAANFIVTTIFSPSLKGSLVVNDTGMPVPFASVRMFSRKDGLMVMRTSTNEKGRFVAILGPGSYDMEINGGTGNVTKPVTMRRQKELNAKVII